MKIHYYYIVLNNKNIKTKIKIYIECYNKIRKSYSLLLNVPKNINEIKKEISRNSYETSNLKGDVMTAAASGIIWLQSTYDLNIPKMTEGKLITNDIENYRSVDKPYFSESLYFEDLFKISHTAMKIGLFAVAIKFYLASLISHQENKCLFKTIDNICRPYEFNSIETWYLSKHDYSLLNQSSNMNFDSAERFPFRITKG